MYFTFATDKVQNVWDMHTFAHYKDIAGLLNSLLQDFGIFGKTLVFSAVVRYEIRVFCM